MEIDEYCLKVLEKHWPDVQRWTDITKLTGKELPEADLWTGGFPCQDLSVAGKQAGIDGKRSGLFFELMRLVRTVRPSYILLENVPGILSTGHGRVQGELAEAGYHALWFDLSAADVGASHLRRRWFCVCWQWGEEWPFMGNTELYGCNSNETERNDRALGRATGKTSKEQCKQTTESSNPSQDVANTEKQRMEGYGASGQQKSYTHGQEKLSVCKNERSRTTQWAVEPNVGRVADGVPARVDRLKCLGNAVVPVVAQYIGEHLRET